MPSQDNSTQSGKKDRIIEKLFPGKLPAPDEISGKYPSRKLEPGAMVTRIAPSPTGYMHIGGLFAALVSERLAHQTGGVFYLRIEDTDRKREVEGAADMILTSLDRYGIRVDEGPRVGGEESGSYGPYRQSDRSVFYKTYVKSLLERDLAYPCFCTPEELEEMRSMQESRSVRPGYYGQWAKWRDRTEDEVLKELSGNRPFVIRFRSDGDIGNKIVVKDEVKGDKELSENDQDIVIMKSDGLPTYHFAHIVDDHLMGTTDVIRGDEWLTSTPLHLQLFEAMGWEPPRYGHLSPIKKLEGSSRRKLSKRKDPEASVSYYDVQGYPEDAIIEYLLNLANSNFEDWRKTNPEKDNREFLLTFERLSGSGGALFDFAKLDDVSKETVSRYSADTVYEKGLEWAKAHDPKLADRMGNNPDYVKRILNIERGGTTKNRKDIGKWSDIGNELEYFFDDTFHPSEEEMTTGLSGILPEDMKSVIKAFMASYDEKDTSEEWFEKIKTIARDNGFAENAKLFKKNPELFRGNVADVARIFRVALTGKTRTPDLYSIIHVMGTERVFERLSALLRSEG
ncbi:MAG: glutamate--tRNA ligase [Candidatus Moranbacteria bacterium]|nr:glutamate--tRNA ligase [Candidatus Moranbacteria bacterium]